MAVTKVKLVDSAEKMRAQNEGYSIILSSNIQGELVLLLSTLANGCKKHPAYRAIRPATGKCDQCTQLWAAKKRVIELQADK
jgi:hypothetical protein